MLPSSRLVAVPIQVVINRAACIGCNVCVEVCPTDVLRLDDQRKAFPKYLDDCEGCFLCEFDCPVNAVRVETHKFFNSAKS